MTDNDDDNSIIKLTAALNKVQISREIALAQLEQANQQETLLLERLVTARSTRIDRARTEQPDVNPFSVGDHVRITNHLRDEHGTTGIVISTSRDDRLVKLQNEHTRKKYQRAWWNLEIFRTSA